MLRPEQVPEAVAYEVYRRFEMDTEREAAEAIAAAINAWPGVDFETYTKYAVVPLTANDDHKYGKALPQEGE